MTEPNIDLPTPNPTEELRLLRKLDGLTEELLQSDITRRKIVQQNRESISEIYDFLETLRFNHIKNKYILYAVAETAGISEKAIDKIREFAETETRKVYLENNQQPPY